MTATHQNTLTVQVPFEIRKQGGRKEIVLPAGATLPRIRIDNTTLSDISAHGTV